MSAPIFNDNNVYIFGAGFSKEAGLPLVREFLNRMRDSRSWLMQEGRERELRAIDKLFAFRSKASSAAERICIDLENIEELFSLAAAATAGNSLTKDAVLAIAATLDYAEATEPARKESISVVAKGVKIPSGWKLVTVSSAGGQARYECSLFEFFMLLLLGGSADEDWPESRSNTIITLNYDLLVEDALYSLGIPFKYGLGAVHTVHFDQSARCAWPPVRADGDKAVPVLKLHGSVNWAGDRPRLTPRITVYGTYDNVREANKSPLLVPPTWRKAMGGQLLNVWDLAVAALHNATRVIVIGYSMPQTDQHFKYLLAAGLQGNISLRQILFVNPAAGQLEESLFRVLRPDLNGQIVQLHRQPAQQFIRQASLIGRGLSPRFGY